MPIPRPRPNEKQSDYVSRCMGAIGGEYDDKKQAVAICFSTYKKGRKMKTKRRKAYKLYVRKSQAENNAKLLLHGISMICGTGSQGEVYYDKHSQVARVVLRPDRDQGMFDTWKQQVCNVLGINEARLSVTPSAPRGWGEGSSWVHIRPDGQVEIDPMLAAVTRPADVVDDHGDVLPTLETESPAELPAVPTKIAARYVESGPILKADENPDFMFVMGPIMVPEKADRQGDVIAPEEIEKASHGYVEDSQRAGMQHAVVLKKRDIVMVESHIVRSDNYVLEGTPVTKGTWLVGFRVYNPEIRKAIKSGRFRGFSIGGDGFVKP